MIKKIKWMNHLFFFGCSFRSNSHFQERLGDFWFLAEAGLFLHLQEVGPKGHLYWTCLPEGLHWMNSPPLLLSTFVTHVVRDRRVIVESHRIKICTETKVSVAESLSQHPKALQSWDAQRRPWRCWETHTTSNLRLYYHLFFIYIYIYLFTFSLCVKMII